jgi:hypothetical protein
MITMYEMIMTSALDANACLTPRGVTEHKARRTGAQDPKKSKRIQTENS